MPHLGTFGVPLVSPELSHEPGRKLADILSGHLGHPVETRVFGNYSELTDALAEGRVDFAWLPPVEAHLLSEHTGVSLLLQAVRGGRPHYHSVLFVREDSPLADLHDLDGRTVAFVHRRSASGFLVAAARLRELGIRTPVPPAWLGSHGAVVEAVDQGRYEAGCTYATLTDDGLQEASWQQVDPPRAMRPLGTAGPIPTDAICAWPGTSRQARQDFVVAFRAAMDQPEQAEVMARLFGTDRFEDSRIDSYDVLASAFDRLRPSRGGA